MSVKLIHEHLNHYNYEIKKFFHALTYLETATLNQSYEYIVVQTLWFYTMMYRHNF